MEELLTLDTLEQVKAISNPIRYQITNLVVPKAMTGSQIARTLDLPRQRTHYHLKILEKAGIIHLQEEKINKGMLEKYYRATAKIILVNPNFGENLYPSDLPKAQTTQNKAYKDIKTIMLNQVQADLSQPDVEKKISKLRSSLQYTFYLTPEQEREAKNQLETILEYYNELSDKNYNNLEKEKMLCARYTLLITPPNLPENDPEPGETQD